MLFKARRIGRIHSILSFWSMEQDVTNGLATSFISIVYLFSVVDGNVVQRPEEPKTE